jgi:hypothetical protein
LLSATGKIYLNLETDLLATKANMIYRNNVALSTIAPDDADLPAIFVSV